MADDIDPPEGYCRRCAMNKIERKPGRGRPPKYCNDCKPIVQKEFWDNKNKGKDK